MTSPDGFAASYGVELLCREKPTISKPALLAALRKRLPAVQPLDGKEDSPLLAFIHPDHPVSFGDRSLPAQTFIAVADNAVDLEALEPALQQSWQFPAARECAQQCTGTVLVTDLLSSPLDRRERLPLFQKALAAVLEVVPCEAIVWRPSQQLVDPAEYVKTLDEPDYPRFFAGAVNVRFFNVADAAEDKVMDTMGLAALGMPDLQCHFRGLDPTHVARVLYNTALYIYERGDVIEDGHTVQGIKPNDKWRCRHEDALIGPKRVVVDLNPGRPYAAGERS